MHDFLFEILYGSRSEALAYTFTCTELELRSVLKQTLLRLKIKFNGDIGM